jgi:prepilin-type processing-associated H-X9-DG protein
MPDRTKSRSNGNLIIKAILLLVGLFIVAAILFPIFTKAKEGENRDFCRSNLKQLGLAFMQYSQDYDDKMPTGTGWAYQVYPYIKSTGVYKCSFDDTSAPTNGKYVTSYAYNSNIGQPKGYKLPGDPASNTVLLFEVSNGCFSPDTGADATTTAQTTPSPTGDGTTLHLADGNPTCMAQLATGDIGKRPAQSGTPERHEGGANYLLLDGQVKWFKAEQVSSGADAIKPEDGQTGGIIGNAAGTADEGYEATFSRR